MALLPQHKYFVYNNEIVPVSEFVPSENEGGIYEVLRVEQGVPLFLEDHLERFFHSANIAGKSIRYTTAQILELLKRLIAENRVTVGNILISCKINLKAFFIPHNYPVDEMYNSGVICGILHAERKNPNAKVFQTKVREQSNKLIAEQGFYEVMLVDHFGRITEGSRSNVFFVQENTLITPPGNEVLLGITRKKAIFLAEKLKINFREEDIFFKELETFSGAVITGTSPKILPVKKLEHTVFDPQIKIIRELILGYQHLIDEYISANK